MAVGVRFKIFERDRGMRKLFEQILPELAKLDPHVRVGIFADKKGGGEAREGGLTNVELAAIHEFGAPEASIPERSFIRSTAREKAGDYVTLAKRILKGVLVGKHTPKDLFDMLGAKMVADINKKVRSEGVPPPLAASTIARKGSSRALIDTGLMLASLTWVVIFGDREAA